jgi:hypothetical protein
MDIIKNGKTQKINIKDKLDATQNAKNNENKFVRSTENINEAKDKYPISVNGQQCIGPCYYSKTKIIHPLTLEEIEGLDYNFCPVNTFVYTSKKTGKSTLLKTDDCYVPTSRETKMDDLLRNNIITPQFIFSSEYFVKIYYKINNLDDMFKWLDVNKNEPYRTKERVFNNSMVVYSEHLNIIDHRLVYFINDMMIAQLPKIFRNIKKYLSVVGSNASKQVELINQNGTEKKIKKKDIRIVRKYIKDTFLGIENIHQFMSKVIRYYKEELNSRDISNTLVDLMIEYIIKRINLTTG